MVNGLREWRRVGWARSFDWGPGRGRLWRRDGSVRGGGEDRLIDTKGDADGEGGLRVGHLLAQAETDRGSGCLSCCLSCCLSAAFWMVRKTWATSRSRVENSRSMTLRRGWRMTST